MLDLVNNAEQYYRDISQLRQQRIDSLQHAVGFFMEAYAINKDLKLGMTDLINLWKKADDVQKATIVQLQADLKSEQDKTKKLTRRKNFWRGTAIVVSTVAVLETVYIVIIQQIKIF